MSLRAMLWVLDEAPTADAGVWAVLVALADDADDDGECYPSIERLARRSRRSPSGVRRILARCEEAGLVEVERPDRQGRGHHNRYRLALDKGARDATLPEPERVAEGARDATLLGAEKGAKGRVGDRKRARRVASVARKPVDPLPVDPKNTRASDGEPEQEFEFDVWWSAIRAPMRRTGKEAARRAFVRARRSVELGVLVAAVTRYGEEQATAGADPRYVKHPATWLNGGCWDDDPLPDAPPDPAARPVPGAYRRPPPPDPDTQAANVARVRSLRGTS